MIVDEKRSAILLGNYNDNLMPINNEVIPNYNLGSSQVIEPEIISAEISTPPVKNYIVKSPDEIPPLLQGSPNDEVSENSPKPYSESSETTDETKTYVGGGTTPDSNIVIKKPTSKYFLYGIVGVVGALIIYKIFFNKKQT